MANPIDEGIVKVGFVGLGQMGKPMARNLATAGYALVLNDKDSKLASALADEIGCEACNDFGNLGAACEIVITMLPSSDIVRSVVVGDGKQSGMMKTLSGGNVLVDMSSSRPQSTLELAEILKDFDVALLDAPVSGGKRKAVSGGLSIMLGGDSNDAIKRAVPVLESMGRVYLTGRLGSGHALKALNNYLNAVGLRAACEAIAVGTAFGLNPDTMLDVINVSTGRNNSTENKIAQFVLSGEFKKAGFAMNLMAKDLAIAADLAESLGFEDTGIEAERALWMSASDQLGETADHTEIFQCVSRPLSDPI
ncbi:MAG: NAD(P)-dependent oxidoreductase [Alphaproteobacteria bacterium]